jgi:hypothetical protein
MGLFLQHLLRYADEGEDMLNKNVSASLLTRFKASFSAMETSQFIMNQNYKVTPSAGKVMLTVFMDSQEVLLAHFQKRGENVNSESYLEVLLKLQKISRPTGKKHTDSS